MPNGINSVFCIKHLPLGTDSTPETKYLLFHFAEDLAVSITRPRKYLYPTIRFMVMPMNLDRDSDTGLDRDRNRDKDRNRRGHGHVFAKR
jgi:hypothetical protein